MKHYAVFDTNVLVSAMITNNSESPTVKVMEKVADGNIIPIFNYEIIATLSPEEYSKELLD